MTIIQSAKQFLFGGYTSISWSTNTGPKKDTQAFLFTLINPHNIPPTKYPINPDKTGNAVYHFHAYRPSFGDNADIQIVRSFIKFPISYMGTTGKGNKTFTGERDFATCDKLSMELLHQSVKRTITVGCLPIHDDRFPISSIDQHPCPL